MSEAVTALGDEYGHEKRVLAGVVPDRKDNLLYMLQHLEPDHFRLDRNRNFYTMLERYYDVASGVLPRKTLSDLMSRVENVDAAKVLLYEEAYAELENLELPDHEFRYSVDALKDKRGHQLTGEAFAVGYEILERGAVPPGGKDTLKGAKEARAYVIDRFAHIDKLDALEVAPEGDMNHEGSEVLKEYMDAKDGKNGIGVMSGIKAVDDATGGFQKGELSLLCAYTNQGKSQLACQVAWYAAVKQGINFMFATSETSRATVRRRLIARHSREPQFGLEHGLNTTDIRSGTLSPMEEKAFVAVVKDLDTNPNYGKQYIAQIPRGANLAYVETRFNRQQTMWDIGLGIVDYLALLRSERARQSEREEFNDILRSSKTFATSFNDGNGVPLVSPWQIKRESFIDALRTGYYGLGALSDTTEAEKSSDQIITILRQPEVKDEATLHFLKMRDNEIPDPVSVRIDYRNSFFTDKTSGSFGNALGTSSFGI